jgi:hypothetical protein
MAKILTPLVPRRATALSPFTNACQVVSRYIQVAPVSSSLLTCIHFFREVRKILGTNAPAALAHVVPLFLANAVPFPTANSASLLMDANLIVSVFNMVEAYVEDFHDALFDALKQIFPIIIKHVLPLLTHPENNNNNNNNNNDSDVFKTPTNIISEVDRERRQFDEAFCSLMFKVFTVSPSLSSFLLSPDLLQSLPTILMAFIQIATGFSNVSCRLHIVSIFNAIIKSSSDSLWHQQAGMHDFLVQKVFPALYTCLKTPPSSSTEASSRKLSEYVADFHCIAATNIPQFRDYVRTVFAPALQVTPENRNKIIQYTENPSKEFIGMFYLSLLPQKRL